MSSFKKMSCLVKEIKEKDIVFKIYTFEFVYKMQYQKKTEFFNTIEQAEKRINEIIK